MIDLRDLVEADAEHLFRWRRDPDVNRWMCDSPPQTLEAWSQWVRDCRVDADRRGWIVTRGGAPVGFLTLTGLSGTHRRAEWGWYIGDADARGRGVGRAAQALGLDRAFEELGLEKVWAEVLADNDAALKAQAAAGFQREGYLRNHALNDGGFRDVALLAILAHEWRARRDQVRQQLAAARLIAA
jgi:UDP-4-amino-4,6-dideoxy-N-acetyl-beta-L-altrosamine N-acetyltransferase